MTIERQDFRVYYDITPDVDRYPFAFPAMMAAHIHAFHLDPAYPEYDPLHRVEILDAVVVPAANGIRHGGEVYLPTKPPVGHQLEIARVTPKTQGHGFQSQQRIPPESIESALDWLTMIVQEEAFGDVFTDINDELYRLVEAVERLEAEKATKTALQTAINAFMQEVLLLQQTKADKSDVNHALSLKEDKTNLKAMAYADDAPADGAEYVRKNRTWAKQTGGGSGLPEGGEAGDVLGKNAQNLAAWLSPAAVADNLPTMSATQFGVAKVGAGLGVSPDGSLYTTSGGGNAVVANTDNIVDTVSGYTQTVVNTGFRADIANVTTAMAAVRLDLAQTDAIVADLDDAVDAIATGVSGLGKQVFINAALAKTGTTWTATATLPAPVPTLVTLRAIAPADYVAGDELTVNGTPYSLLTPAREALANDAWKAGGGVEMLLDTSSSRATYTPPPTTVSDEGYYQASGATNGTEAVILTVPLLPTPPPDTFTVRYKSPAAYTAGKKIRIGSKDYDAFLWNGEAMPDDHVVQGAVAAPNFDEASGKCFFRRGVVGGDPEWIGTTQLPAHNWNTTAYGRVNGKGVIVALGSLAAYSLDDGASWTETTLPVPKSLSCVTFGGDKFVAVGSGTNQGLYSYDGITWTVFTLPLTLHWSSVCYGDGKFVAVGNSSATNQGAYSYDGITWTAFTFPTKTWWAKVAFGNGRFVAIASTNCAYSLNGISWTSSTLPSGSWNTIAFGDDKFVCISVSSSMCCYSSDGVTWLVASAGTASGTTSNLCYGNGLFIYYRANVVGVTGKAFYSKNFPEWNELEMPASTREWTGFCFGSARFIAVAQLNYTPADGITAAYSKNL